jgi:hypothetical protein
MKSSVVHPTSMTTIRTKKWYKKRTLHVVCNLRYNRWNCLGIFLPRQTMKNRNLRRQLQSAEANFEGWTLTNFNRMFSILIKLWPTFSIWGGGGVPPVATSLVVMPDYFTHQSKGDNQLTISHVSSWTIELHCTPMCSTLLFYSVECQTILLGKGRVLPLNGLMSICPFSSILQNPFSSEPFFLHTDERHCACG